MLLSILLNHILIVVNLLICSLVILGLTNWRNWVCWLHSYRCLIFEHKRWYLLFYLLGCLLYKHIGILFAFICDYIFELLTLTALVRCIHGTAELSHIFILDDTFIWIVVKGQLILQLLLWGCFFAWSIVLEPYSAIAKVRSRVSQPILCFNVVTDHGSRKFSHVRLIEPLWNDLMSPN